MNIFVEYGDSIVDNVERESSIPCSVSERKLSSRLAVLSIEPGRGAQWLQQHFGPLSSAIEPELQCDLGGFEPVFGFLRSDPSGTSVTRLASFKAPRSFRGRGGQTKRDRLIALEDRFASIWRGAQNQLVPKTNKYFLAALILEAEAVQAYPELRPRLQPISQQLVSAIAGFRADLESEPSVAECRRSFQNLATRSSAENCMTHSFGTNIDRERDIQLPSGRVQDYVRADDRKTDTMAGSGLFSSKMPAVHREEATKISAKMPHLGLQPVHFSVQCDDSVSQLLASTTGRWNLFLTGSATELGSWNLNVARKLDYAAQERVFHTTVPFFPATASHQEAIRYVYFLLDDRLSDRCATRVLFEVRETEANDGAAAPALGAAQRSPAASSIQDSFSARGSYPRLRSFYRTDVVKAVHVHDYIHAAQVPGGHVRFRVRMDASAAASGSDRAPKKLYITGDVYQLGLWTQPGLISMQPLPFESNVWELSIARPPWDDIEYTYAVETQCGAMIQYECKTTRFRDFGNSANDADCWVTWEDELQLSRTEPSHECKFLSVSPAILFGPYIPAAELSTELAKITAFAGRPLGLLVTFLPYERLHGTSPMEREQLQASASRLGVHLVPVSLPSNRLLMTVDWVLGPEASVPAAERDTLAKAMLLTEAILSRGCAVYFTSAGSYRVLATFLAALWQRTACADSDQSLERFQELLIGVQRETGFIGLPSYALWHFLTSLPVR